MAFLAKEMFLMKTQILLVILQLNKPLSTSYRSPKSSSLSFWSPNYGSNLHKGHFPSYSACCDMIHAFCLLLGIWGCLWRTVINTASNSSFHKMLYSQEKKKRERKSHPMCTSYHFHSHCHLALFLLPSSYSYWKDVRPVPGRLWSTRFSATAGNLMGQRHFRDNQSCKWAFEGWSWRLMYLGAEVMHKNPTYHDVYR